MFGQEISAVGHKPYNHRPKQSLFLAGNNFYKSPNLVQVGPRPNPIEAFESESNGIIYENLKPMFLLIRACGLCPISVTGPGNFFVTPTMLGYCVCLFIFVVSYIGYIQWDKVELMKSAEGRFEEAVIDYLFSVYLLPVVAIPVTWYESRKLAAVFRDWAKFEDIYKRVVGKKIPLHLGNKPLFTTLALPIISCATMTVTHVTMAHFRIIQVIPYCYINSVTYLIGGIWYLHCNVIGKVATILAEDFEKALHHVGPSSLVADYRSMWMLLSRIIRDVGMASCYVLTFLSLYLFLVITLTIYGLLSQLQEGMGVKDIGLTITAAFAVALLYFICDEAHYASNCVKVKFQKKILLVELSWMNEDAQQEVSMFLRATEMNETEMSLGGFFDVDRTLFKSLLATMVTYLVVLLQFQISLPEEAPAESTLTTVISAITSTVKGI